MGGYLGSVRALHIYILTYGVCILTVTTSSIIIQLAYMYTHFANLDLYPMKALHNNSTLV